MKSLLEAKAKQCTEFRSFLLENSGKVFAEATPSKLWATGLSPFLIENTTPEFWLGRNLLGALLGELALHLSSNGLERCVYSNFGSCNVLLQIQIQNDLTSSSSSQSDETTLTDNQITPSQQNDPMDKDTDHKPDHEPDNLECNDQHTQLTELPGYGGTENCSPLGDDPRDQSPQQKQQDQQNHHDVAEHMKTPLKTVNQNRTTHRSRNRTPQLENQRPRSSSVSHIQWKKDSLVDQDIRAALSKRKAQASSPDEKSGTRDKIQKSDVT